MHLIDMAAFIFSNAVLILIKICEILSVLYLWQMSQALKYKKVSSNEELQVFLILLLLLLLLLFN